MSSNRRDFEKVDAKCRPTVSFILRRPCLHGTRQVWDRFTSGSEWIRQESGSKLFQIARSLTWDQIINWIAKITADFAERHLVVEGQKPGRKLEILKKLLKNALAYDKLLRLACRSFKTNLTELKAWTA